MTEPTPGATPEAGGGDSYTPPATQAELDRIITDRLARERARFADYDALKAKATEFDKQADAQKSETQKALERAEAAEQRAATAEQAALRASVAAEKGVPASSLTGATKDELEASADQLIAWRDQKKDPTPPKAPARGLGSGASNSGQQPDGKERAAAALRALRNQ